mgnify:CR=1 FL=1
MTGSDQSPEQGEVHAGGEMGVAPVVAGALAAVVGGAVWALVVRLTDYEVGWVTWGARALVGVAMSRATTVRSTRAATLAATFALIGLLFGKVFIQHFVTRPAFEQGLREEESSAVFANTWRLRDQKAFPEAIQVRLDSVAETDTLSDALWEDMVAASEEHLATLSQEEREQLTAEYAAEISGRVGAWQQMMWGFSLYDVLWFGLAITTAWGLLKPRPEVLAESGTA